MKRIRIAGGRLLLFTAIILYFALPAGAAAPETRLAADGQALQRVVTGSAATEKIKKSAANLAAYLGRISGATFEVVTGDGSSGLAVGLPGDFPKLAVKTDFHPERPTGREDYLLRTHKGGVYLLGATELAVDNAVWDFLYRLGYRQFFPGEKWEVVPKVTSLSVALDDLQRPSYFKRNIVSNYGQIRKIRDDNNPWLTRNRAVSGLNIEAGHAYGFIINAKKKEFEAHPEYLALVNGKRGGSKFCISNPGLRRLVTEYACEYLQKNPTRECVSLDPSDGGGWCECPECAKMGSVSTRVVMLANEAAEAINKLGLGDRYVGILAYNHHQSPPEITVHPRVAVMISLYGGSTSQRVLESRMKQVRGWRARGATLGISDYLSTYVWDFSLPGRPKSADLQYIKKSIPLFRENDITLYGCSFGNDWGPTGPGMWLAARLLWDVKEAGRLDDLFSDFLDKAFGPAREAMRDYYQLTDGGSNPLLSEDLVGRMYRHLDRALALAGNDGAIRARIMDLILYTRYVELYMRHINAPAAERQPRFQELMRYAYSIRETGMANFRMIVMILPDKNKDIPLPEGDAWKKALSPNETETLDILKAGMAANKPFDFQPVRYSDDLVPARQLNQAEVAVGNFGGYPVRGPRVTIYTWVDEPGEIILKVTGNPGRDGQSVSEIALYPHEEAEGTPSDVFLGVLQSEPREIRLKTPLRGLHRLDAWGSSLRIEFAEPGRAYTVPSGIEAVNNCHNWSLCFYVPKGTKVLGGFSSNRNGEVLDGDGKKIFSFDQMAGPGYFSLPVPPGQAGRIWRINKSMGQKLLMTVPPYMARSVSELLLPREVVEADK